MIERYSAAYEKGVTSCADPALSSKRLEQDPTEKTNQLLSTLISHLNGSKIPSRSELAFDHFVAPSSARVTNAFWFLSLALALVVSMLAILAKQWITMFSLRMRAPVANFRLWAHRHRTLRDGFDRWHISAFISGLSVALHGAVLLFLSGLTVHLFSRDIVIFGLVLFVTFFAATFYAAATLAPLYDRTCPTATPLLAHGRLVYLALVRALRSMSKAQGRDPEVGNPSTLSNKPPYPDSILDAGDDAEKDTRILFSMVSELPTGHDDVSAALDALGGLDTQRHHLVGKELVTLRNATRIRLERLSTVTTAPIDAAAVARMLRSALHTEGADLSTPSWDFFAPMIQAFKKIRTHDVFALSVALHQLRLKQEMKLELHSQGAELLVHHNSWADLYSHIDTYPCNTSRDQNDVQLALRQKLQKSEFQVIMELVEPMARWNTCGPFKSPPRMALAAWTRLLEGIFECKSSAIRVESSDIPLAATIILAFSSISRLDPLCHGITTSFVTARILRDSGQKPCSADKESHRPRWFPHHSSTDWNTRAISVWAYVKSQNQIDETDKQSNASNNIYEQLLLRWRYQKQWAPLATAEDLWQIILPAQQLSSMVSLCAPLWRIAYATWGAHRLVPDIDVVHIILNRTGFKRMSSIIPTIASSLTSVVLSWITFTHDPSHVCSGGYPEASLVHARLLSILQPLDRAGYGHTRSTWEVVRPYLMVPSQTDGLAKILVQASAILSSRADQVRDVGLLFEELLGHGIGIRLVTSSKRDEAYFVARHAYLFATKWWEETRSQLETDASRWMATDGLEDVVTFVRRVEEAGACLTCSQASYLNLLQLEDEQYLDAWIEHAVKGPEAEVIMSLCDALM